MTYDQAVRAWLDSLSRDDLEALARDYRRGDTDAAAVDAHREVMRLGRLDGVHAEAIREWRKRLTDDECAAYNNRRQKRREGEWDVRAGAAEYDKRRRHRREAAA